jgi:peptidoglycan hydrolase-like protein with peptidoglycan-binding domain
MARVCVTASESTDDDSLARRAGHAVELLIHYHYCGSNIIECGIYPLPGAMHFFDLAIGLHRCDLLGGFLGTMNPGYNGFATSQQCKARKPDPKGAFKIPDIVSHRATEEIFEFYEVKPNSAPGIAAGQEKVGFFTDLCKNTLPYHAGTLYTGGSEIFWNGTYLGSPLVLEVQWVLNQPGLLVYDICGRVDRETLKDMLKAGLLKAFIIAVVAMLAAALRAPGFRIPPVGTPVVALAQPVGPQQANLTADVTFVQHLLNDWRGRSGLESIAVDGLPGPETNGAIIDFQTTVTGVVDGVISAAGPAIAALEHQHLDAWPAGLTPEMQTWISQVAVTVASSEDEERLSEDQEDAEYLATVNEYFTSLYQGA